ncbi:uncharacterized protein AMSG_01957 [Thecamonas trahens ATCC 50062]|uniref:Uncharacterized protein n=1 Tax=Thecamonas trahens ATCC 50062 TaxID=461836 RepID=A0A0L0DVZ7_THETB|nr:hypothetical protein AMSG_01957 [Thecamonas trahens ATCC 50062]KNC55688.1 hypothetical protein AMSG_01957 [Thecamonas trahens ATCC 50062]|eukprot:XP_013761455.1 hypothetical protein AMSG_01957 [Thecamonas trahens ATCC 50062]
MGTTTKRIVFPWNYPVIEKTIRMDLELTGQAAVDIVREKSRCYNIDAQTCFLYLPEAKRQIGNDEILGDVESLPSEEFLELRDPNSGPKPGEGSKKSCTIL